MSMKTALITIFSVVTIALGTLFIFMHTNTNQRHINNVFNIARETRPIPMSKLEYMLTDYSIDNHTTKTIQNFLVQTTGLKIDLENIIQSTITEPQAGLSGNPLFFIKDKQNNLKVVVKIFENPFTQTGEFISELSGFQIASTIYGKHFHFISAQAVGKAMINGKTYGLLAISPTSGISIQDLIIKIFRCKPASPERTEALHIAAHAFEKLGKALAELHHIRVRKNVNIHHALIEQAEQNLNNTIIHLIKENYGIDLEALKQYFEQLKNKLQKTKITRSLAHGDPNLGNFMYDEKEDTIFIVDLSSLNFAADREGNPIQSAALDFMGILNSISVNKAFGINKKEQTELKRAFTNAYGSTPMEVEQKFFALEQQLKMLSFFLNLKQKTRLHKTLTKADKIADLILKFEIEKLKKSVNPEK